MITDDERREHIGLAVQIAKRRLKELDSKPRLTKAESYERDMTVDTIYHGELVLNKPPLIAEKESGRC